MKNIEDKLKKWGLHYYDGRGITLTDPKILKTLRELRECLAALPDEMADAELTGILGSEKDKLLWGPKAKAIVIYMAPCSPPKLAIHLIGE